MNDINFDINKLSLDDITMVNAAITNDTGITKLHADEEIEINCNIESGVNIQMKKIRTILHCKLSVKQNPQITGSFSLAYIFTVQELDKYIKLDEKEVVIEMHKELLETLANITYSTSRGIIYSRCLGTIFNKVVLPISSTQKILNSLQ